MSLKNRLENIKRFLKKRYKNNLAAILIFGSANTGEYRERESDIDTIILLKKQNNFDFKKELKFVSKKFKSENFAIHHLTTIKNYEKHIYDEGSWSSWITTIKGCKKIYSTSEFLKFRKRLISKPISQKKLIKYLKKKDEFELKEKLTGYKKTKWIMSHLRRKLQVMNYFEGKELIFDYEKCFNNINLVNDEKRKLEKLYNSYGKRKSLSKREVQEYYKLAEELTRRILKI